MRLVTSSLTWITLTLDILLCLPGRMLNWVVESSEVVLGERVSFPRNQPHLGPAGDPLSPRLHTLRASQCSASMLSSRAGWDCIGLASDASSWQFIGHPQSPTSDSWTAPDILKGSGSQLTCRTLSVSPRGALSQRWSVAWQLSSTQARERKWFSSGYPPPLYTSRESSLTSGVSAPCS